MIREGKYIYCIIEADREYDFGPKGIGGRGNLVTTIGYEGLSMVVSDYPLNRVLVDADAMLAHERVIEAVMNEFDSVIPVQFGTVASTPDEIRNLLDRRYGELSGMLMTLRNMVEFSLKGRWRNIGDIYKRIDRANPDIKHFRVKIRSQAHDDPEQQALIQEAGSRIEKALAAIKEEKCDEIMAVFRRTVADSKFNTTTSPEMFINAVFLIDKGREVEFDDIMQMIGDRDAGQCDYRYGGPFPIFDFVSLRILPEKWEL